MGNATDGPSWGRRVLRFRLMVDVVCVEQPQASWEERSMKHYAGLDVSVKETSICIVDEAGRICREMKVVMNAKNDKPGIRDGEASHGPHERRVVARHRASHGFQ